MSIFDISFYGLHIAPTWYGLSYALGFIICYFFVSRFYFFRQKDHLDTLLSYIFIGIILGGRLGYVLLYHLSYYIEYPFDIVKIWEGGMSFHGGLLGVILAVYLFAKRYTYEFWSLIDTLAIIIPVALGLGRVGNWINQELPGYTPYDGAFPMTIAGASHFPSPLLAMLLEGICLLILMLGFWRLQKLGIWNHRSGILSGIFLIGYSTARLISEQYRLPDSHIGYLLDTDWVTLGILYTVPMMGYGVYLVIKNFRFLKNKKFKAEKFFR